MKAIILAAGKSSRLHPLTLDKPKCLLELEEGMTIIDYQIKLLKECGITDIVVVVGHLKERIKDFLGDRVRYKEFNDFEKYNNLHTLYNVKEELNDDFVCLFSDVILSKELLKKCIDSREDFCLLVHNKEILKDTMRVQIKGESIVNIGSHILPEEGDGNFIGIGKYSKKAAELMIKEMETMVENAEHDGDYYTMPLIEIAKNNKIGYEFAENLPWIEMDFLEDYEKAKKEIYPLIK